MAIKAKSEESAAGVGTPAPLTGSEPAGAAAPVPNAPGVGPAAAAATVGHGVGQQQAHPTQIQTNMKEGVEKAMKTAEEFVAFGQGNLEALLKSGQIWVNGLQDIGKQMAANAQAQLEETVSAFKAITGAKSVKDAFDLQAGFARAAIEKTIAESGKLTESSVKLTEQALAPITQRWAVAVEKFARPVV